MINNFLQRSKVAAVILTLIRLWLGINWVKGGFEKITGGFSAKGFIVNAIHNPVMDPTGNQAFPWYTEFLKITTGNGAHTDVFSFLVGWGELLVGLGLIFGTLTLAAAFFGLFLNFSYLLAGTISVNPTYIVLEFILLFGGANSGKIGLDYWVMPKIRQILNHRRIKN